jgi:protein-tyrosine phosphatase
LYRAISREFKVAQTLSESFVPLRSPVRSVRQTPNAERLRALVLSSFSSYHDPVTKRILFICTGNFYRSRFAEAVFNHHATRKGLSWTAFSRGLAIHLAEGPISPFTQDALTVRQIDLRHTAANRVSLSADDFLDSERQIAMDRTEHYPMMQQHFPNWADKIHYWDVGDVPFRLPHEALPEIERRVTQLFEELSE